jgi:ribulose-5-phosphate 4-epimerase/fuculose-1-phosphate aldolase
VWKLALREQIAELARELESPGRLWLTADSISARSRSALAVTPSGIPSTDLESADVVLNRATCGSEELAGLAFATLAGGQWAALLASHGAVALGAIFGAAPRNAQILEMLAATCCRARAIDEPQILSDEEIGRVEERYGARGQLAAEPGT